MVIFWDTYTCIALLTLSETTNFRPFQNEKEFADNNFKFDGNARKFFKWLENTVGKGEIDRYEQFHLFPQCFRRVVLQTRKNQGLFGKGLILIGHGYMGAYPIA